MFDFSFDFWCQYLWVISTWNLLKEKSMHVIMNSIEKCIEKLKTFVI